MRYRGASGWRCRIYLLRQGLDERDDVMSQWGKTMKNIVDSVVEQWQAKFSEFQSNFFRTFLDVIGLNCIFSFRLGSKL